MRSAPPAHRTRVAVGAVALGLALTGCGANFQAQTYRERPTSDGTNAAVGAIALRNVQIVAPENNEMHRAGADADVAFVLTNDGPDDDRLVDITSPDAASVELTQGGQGSPVNEVPLPRLSSTETNYGAVLQGLRDDLRPGEYAELTFRFQRNGSVTVQAPVATTYENDQDERERSEYYHPIGEEGHGEESGGAESGGQGSGGLEESGEQTTQEQTGGEGSNQ